MIGSVERLELDKILSEVSVHAVTEGSKARVLAVRPVTELGEANALLDCVSEASKLLFELGSGRIEYFPPLADKAERAQKGATLSCAELTDTALLMRSARVFYSALRSFADESIIKLKELGEKLYFHEGLERDITDKISGDELLDTASDKLYSLRREIARMQERIRARLSEYLTGEERRYLQDGIVTVRGDRFVIPVKSEYKRSVRGFVHDRSASGATVFIEPEEVLNMNNELVTLMMDEKQEVERILKELSARVGALCESLRADEELLAEIDSYYARAEYAYRIKAVRPKLNDKGVLDIVKGRHPLLDLKAAVPVSVRVGENFDFLVISGANTGGKTVTLKMCGLFCLMGACGLFVPAAEGTRLPVCSNVFCDLGDSQSIEENLSTFSSHVLNLKEIVEHADGKSFALIDEPGGGTDPEEGQALARAILSELVKKGCRGIVTTHFFSLKEFAYEHDRVENACMEFDSESCKPLYRLRLGAPGSSNALSVCERLGLSAEIVELARSFLSEGARSFERTVRAAEESRIRAEAAETRAIERERDLKERLGELAREEEKFRRDREKFLLNSKAEAKRIVADRTAYAEEILAQIEEIFRRETLTEGDLIRARTLKNQIGREETEEVPVRRERIAVDSLKAGDKVYVASLEKEGVVLSVKRDKGQAEVQVGSLRIRADGKDLYAAEESKKPEKGKTQKGGVQVIRHVSDRMNFRPELNLIGKNTLEAREELENFLDSALLNNASEVRIVHGMGTGKLRASVHEYLKKHPHVESFRLGVYGEGQTGVTIALLK